MCTRRPRHASWSTKISYNWLSLLYHTPNTPNTHTHFNLKFRIPAEIVPIDWSHWIRNELMNSIKFFISNCLFLYVGNNKLNDSFIESHQYVHLNTHTHTLNIDINNCMHLVYVIIHRFGYNIQLYSIIFILCWHIFLPFSHVFTFIFNFNLFNMFRLLNYTMVHIADFADVHFVHDCHLWPSNCDSIAQSSKTIIIIDMIGTHKCLFVCFCM